MQIFDGNGRSRLHADADYTQVERIRVNGERLGAQNRWQKQEGEQQKKRRATNPPEYRIQCLSKFHVVEEWKTSSEVFFTPIQVALC